MTDWYCGHDSGDQCFDRLPSPDTWLHWDTCGIGGSSGWVNSFDSGNLLSKNHTQQRAMFSRASNKGTSHVNGVQSNESSDIGGSYNSHRNTAACVHSDNFFNDLTGSDTTDDIFLYRSSLLQDDVLPFQSLYIAVPCDSSTMNMDFRSISCDTDALDHAQISKLSSRNNSDQSSCPSVKVPETRDMVPSYQETLKGTSEVTDFSSQEESVLMKLETLLNQLNDETRVCLRDSLYRLAKHSEKQTSNNDLIEGLPLSRITDTIESATNAIDRAVAYLMFSKVDTNEQDHLPPLSPVYVHDDGNFEVSDLNTFRTSDQLVQCEVPIFSQKIEGSSCQLGVCSQDNTY